MSPGSESSPALTGTLDQEESTRLIPTAQAGSLGSLAGRSTRDAYPTRGDERRLRRAAANVCARVPGAASVGHDRGVRLCSLLVVAVTVSCHSPVPPLRCGQPPGELYRITGSRRPQSQDCEQESTFSHEVIEVFAPGAGRRVLRLRARARRQHRGLLRLNARTRLNQPESAAEPSFRFWSPAVV